MNIIVIIYLIYTDTSTQPAHTTTLVEKEQHAKKKKKFRMIQQRMND